MKPIVESREFGEWVIMQQNPVGEGLYPILLLLHGWTGDENAMWVFTHRLSEKYLMIAPRGKFPVPAGGFGWQPNSSIKWPVVADFRTSIDALVDLLNPKNFPAADFSNISGIGFSQGAALMFTLALLYPHKLNALAGLSGFLPKDVDNLLIGEPLMDKPVFIAHGLLDEIVPVEKARQSVELLTQAGAQVNYCEADVGHKLGASCFRSMESFFAQVEKKN